MGLFSLEILFVCLLEWNIVHIMPIPASSSVTCLIVLPHRNAMTQTQDLKPDLSQQAPSCHDLMTKKERKKDDILFDII